ncbi:Conserved protein, permease-related [Bacillus cereus Rock1-3]|nr:Conserved protein, permease-related [Bacillus cereus Rock1-3]
MMEEMKDGVNMESDKPTKSMMESMAGRRFRNIFHDLNRAFFVLLRSFIKEIPVRTMAKV